MNRLSISRINQKAPYEVKLSRKGFYVFQTEQNISFSISFSEEYEIGGCMSYQFSIDNIGHIHGSYDNKIKDTIIAIIEDFFIENQDVLLYICDTSDNREAARNRLFLRWFKQCSTGKYTICTADSKVEDTNFYMAIIVDNNNSKLEDITLDFRTTAKALSK